MILDREATGFIASAALLGMSLALQYGGLAPWLSYSREAIAQGEIWRLATGHLIHLNGVHWLMNSVAALLIGTTLADRFRPAGWAAVLAGCAAAVSLGLWWASPQTQWYVGLSGVLHGLLVAGALAGLACPHERAFSSALLGAVTLKLLWEQLFGAAPTSAGLIGGAVIVDAHLYGALGGCAIGSVVALRRLASLSPTSDRDNQFSLLKLRFRGSKLATVLLAGSMLTGCQGQASNAAMQTRPGDGDNVGQRAFPVAALVRGEYILELVSGVNAAPVLRRAFGALGVSDIVTLDADRHLFLIRLDQDPGPQAMTERAARIDAIRRVQPNYRYSTQGDSALPSNRIQLK